ncbi:MAG TPA: hypothetical protein PK771_05470 [Spirochaetota bacterium]|nr:hypothetical protein [Spirochaetota bacterium]
MKNILDELKISSQVVQSMKCKFKPTKIHDYYEDESISGHAWLQVTINETTKDVAIGSIENKPGVIDFEVLDKVTKYEGAMKFLGHIASVVVNVYRDNEAIIRQSKLNNHNSKNNIEK